MTRRHRRFNLARIAAISLHAILSLHLAAESQSSPTFTQDQLRFFESKIRPLLAEHCFDCHGEQKQKGGLRLTDRASILHGGDSGPVINLNAPTESLLIEAVRYQNSDFQMPPKDKLPEAKIRLLEHWISEGAPWPAPSNKTTLRNKAFNQEFSITDKDRDYWAFKPFSRKTPPDSRPESSGIESPIDQFINQKLKDQNLQPVPRADRGTLIRRAYFDLIGLPPSYHEVQAFKHDPRDDAYERLIDQLLGRPEYGERYGRHWLDVVRFAQSNGYERDDEKPLAWKYRDYVIRSFNEDKPYDQFIREQIAGDELDQPSRDSLIATGFFRLGVWDDEPDDRRAAEFDGLDDMLRTTSETFLGLTVGCARCHDHMFDPISQKDYYEFLAFFRNIRYYDRPRLKYDSPTYLPLAAPELVEEWQQTLTKIKADYEHEFHSQTEDLRKRLESEKRASLSEAEREALNTPEAKRSEAQSKQAIEAQRKLQVPRDELLDHLPKATREHLEQQFSRIQAFENTPPWDKEDYALGVREHGSQAVDTHLLIRGNAGRPSETVSPRFLEVLTQADAPAPKVQPQKNSSGRRKSLADWISSREHPLTARVYVNRIWQHHFGKGLVATPNDFGNAGIPPSHPDLLDWLATEFVDHGWSTKHLHKVIMTSEAYRRTSSSSSHNEAIDPGNRFLWRQNLRRLEAEAIRDSILACAGTLNPEMHGRGFFPLMGSEVIAGGSRPGRGWGYSDESERARRSVYTFIKRTMGVPLLEVFDYNNTEGSIGARTTTTVAPQALTLLNDEFVHQQAGNLAQELVHSPDSTPAGIIEAAFKRTLSRTPTEREIRVAQAYLEEQKSQHYDMRNQLLFRPAVPSALERAFLRSLPDDRILHSPNHDWRSFRGRWGSEYEGILVADPNHGPFSLWKPLEFTEGNITGRLFAEAATERSCILIKARPYKDSFIGYSLEMDFRNRTVSLIQQFPDRTRLSSVPAKIQNGQWLNFSIQVSREQLRIQFANGQSIEAAVDPATTAFSGHLGIQTEAGATRLDQTSIKVGGKQYNISHTRPSPESSLPIRRIAAVPGWAVEHGSWRLGARPSIQSRDRGFCQLTWRDQHLHPGSTLRAEISLESQGQGFAGLFVALGPQTWSIEIDAAQSDVIVRKHEHDWQEVSRVPALPAINQKHSLAVSMEDESLKIWHGQSGRSIIQLPIDSSNQGQIPRVGLLSRNSKSTFHKVSIVNNAHPRDYSPDFKIAPRKAQPPRLTPNTKAETLGAVRELCSLLFNLNEFIYID